MLSIVILIERTPKHHTVIDPTFRVHGLRCSCCCNVIDLERTLLFSVLICIVYMNSQRQIRRRYRSKRHARSWVFVGINHLPLNSQVVSRPDSGRSQLQLVCRSACALTWFAVEIGGRAGEQS